MGAIAASHFCSHFSPTAFGSIISILNLPFIPALYSTSSPAPTPNVNPLIEQFLTKSCGLSQERAKWASSQLLHLKSIRKPEQALRFFKQHGFTDNHIQDMVNRRPNILTANVERTIQPKLQLFQDLGFKGKNLGALISRNPVLLKVSLSKKLLPDIQFLQKTLITNENVVRALTKEPWILHVDLEGKMHPNISFLESCGIEGKQLLLLFMRKPRFLLSSQDVVKHAVETVEKMGVSRDSNMFGHAILSVGCMSKDTLKRKMECFTSLGVSEEDILAAFKRLPYILASSEEKIRERMHFLVNTLKCESSLIVRYPNFLMFGKERRIQPRYRVLQRLESMKVLEKAPNIFPVFLMPEKSFLAKFVYPYDNEARSLYEIYLGKDGVTAVPDNLSVSDMVIEGMKDTQCV